MENEDITPFIDPATKILEKALEQGLYQDVVAPVSKQIGKTLEILGRYVNMKLSPLENRIWRFEQFEEFKKTELTRKLKNVHSKNIISPPLEIAGPAFESLRYAGNNEELRNLYANLLANSMDKETIANAHPAFIEILKNLSVDEARILKLFINNRVYPIIDLLLTLDHLTPVSIALENYSHIDRYTVLINKNLLPTYIDNLVRLRIIERPHTSIVHPVSSETYKQFEEDPYIISFQEKYTKDRTKIRMERKVLHTTPFGQQFIDNVVKDKE